MENGFLLQILPHIFGFTDIQVQTTSLWISNEILGGYNLIVWKFDYGYNNYIFLDSIENYILSQVVVDILNSMWYEKLIRETIDNFSVEEYEIFQILNN
ncbi:hypothetical protein C1645_841844 [Glomus cerebriforme]|uniref:Uncharacterized protein n=1 Tax=Glomus cerebriforme TaxID=658196 RepID=A0A397S9J7_9GLOM|nr:hypothetical protein C1645_841844 [Glomus cerebriforme]